MNLDLRRDASDQGVELFIWCEGRQRCGFTEGRKVQTGVRVEPICRNEWSSVVACCAVCGMVDHQGEGDWIGSLLLLVGLGTATMLMLRLDGRSWTGQEAVLLTITVLTLAGFILVQLRVPSPTLHLRMFTQPVFSGAMLAVFLSRVLTIGGTVYLVLYFAEGLRLSPTASGLLMTPIFIAQMTTGMVGSKLLTYWPPGLVIGLGYALKGVGFATLAWLITPDTPWWVILVSLTLWGAGGGIAGAPVMAVAVNVTSADRVGMVSGSVSTLASIGAEAVLTVSAALSVLAVVTTLILVSPRRLPRPDRELSPPVHTAVDK